MYAVRFVIHSWVWSKLLYQHWFKSVLPQWFWFKNDSSIIWFVMLVGNLTIFHFPTLVRCDVDVWRWSSQSMAKSLYPFLSRAVFHRALSSGRSSLSRTLKMSSSSSTHTTTFCSTSSPTTFNCLHLLLLLKHMRPRRRWNSALLPSRTVRIVG